MAWIGIDVGKTSLELAVLESSGKLPRRVPNTAPGIAQLVASLAALDPALIVLEPTGTYHRPLLAALLAAELPTAVVHPTQIAAFRQTTLGREKSDHADARLLARFAVIHGASLRRTKPADPIQTRLRDLVAYRDDLVAERIRLRSRRDANAVAGDAAVAAWLAADLERVETRMREVEAETDRLLADLPEAAVLQAMTGVGPRIAAAVLAYLPREIWGNAKAAAAYAGVHPRRDQSGQRDRARLSKRGHAGLRRYLYMGATVALQHDPTLIAYAERLAQRGKHEASAKCAVMHKLLRQMMGRLRAFAAAQATSTLPLAA